MKAPTKRYFECRNCGECWDIELGEPCPNGCRFGAMSGDTSVLRAVAIAAVLMLSGCASPVTEPGIGSIGTRTGETLKSGIQWAVDECDKIIEQGDIISITAPGGFEIHIGDFQNRPILSGT